MGDEYQSNFLSIADAPRRSAIATHKQSMLDLFISFHLFHSQIKTYIDIIIIRNKETENTSVHK